MDKANDQNGAVPVVRYCLYARKSSEQDERQALSIDAQAKEVRQIAERDGLLIASERHESHSAKDSGQRQEFAAMLDDIRSGACNGILTWAPDRLSRNGGDLGQIVDLMDRGKLVEIRTPSQRFANQPSDKFLLMILCSQAKLENDNKSVNVKRGLRAKVEMGYRPNMSPLGYLHDKYAPKGERRVYLDPERAPIIKEAFEKVANHGWTGRQLKGWFDGEKNFLTRKGKRITLSMVYRMMSSPYYTGRFEWPRGSGKWFVGKHEPIVDRKTFDLAQEVMKGTPRDGLTKKEFAFTRMITCGECGSGVSAEEKRKRLKDGTMKRYVYYGCNGKWHTGCKQHYVREENLTEQICKLIDRVEIDKLAAAKKIGAEIEKMKKVALMLGDNDIAEQLQEAVGKFDVRTYAKHILKDGNRDEKRDLLDQLKSRFTIRDGEVHLAMEWVPKQPNAAKRPTLPNSESDSVVFQPDGRK